MRRNWIVLLLVLLPIFVVADSEYIRDRGYLGTSLGIGTQSPDGELDVVGSHAYLPADTAPASDGNFSASQWALWFDEVNNEFELKGKDSGGSIFSATLGKNRAGTHYNILKDSNPGGESNVGLVTPWTSSVTGIFFTATPSEIGFDARAFSWTPVGVDFIKSALVLIPDGLYGQQCEARMFVRGGSNLLTFKVTDGTNTLASKVLSAPTIYKKEAILFVCPQSGSVQIEVLASGAAAEFNWDDAYIGESIENTAMGIATDETDQSANYTINGFGTVTEVEIFDRRVGDTLHIRGSFKGGTPAASQAQIVLRSGYVSNLISGTNQTNMVGNYYNSSAAQLTFGGNAIFGPLHLDHNSAILKFAPRTSSALLEAVNGNQVIGASQRVFFMVQVPIKGWSAEGIGVPVEMQGWFVDVNIGGGSPSLGVGAVAAYIPVPSFDGLDIVINGDSAPAKISCATGNESQTNTCSSPAVEEVIGLEVNFPAAGTYELCSTFEQQMTFDATYAEITTAFQWVETNDNDYTILQEGNGRLAANYLARAGAAGTQHGWPFRVCGVFKFATKGEHTLRLAYEQTTSGPPLTNTVILDRNATAGQRDMHITIIPIAPYQQAPILLRATSVIETTVTPGHGSTNNKILRMTNLVTDTGPGLTFASTAADGASITVDVSGMAHVTVANNATAGRYFGISLNSTQLTTALNSITIADRKALILVSTNVAYSTSASFPVGVGDVIRFHTDGTVDGTALAQFNVYVDH